MCEWILKGIMQLVPNFRRWRPHERFGNEFVPTGHGCATEGADAACEHVQEEQAARDLPSAEIAHTGAAPDMRSQFALAVSNIFRGLYDAFDGYVRFLGGAFEGVFTIQCFQNCIKSFKGNW